MFIGEFSIHIAKLFSFSCAFCCGEVGDEFSFRNSRTCHYDLLQWICLSTSQKSDSSHSTLIVIKKNISKIGYMFNVTNVLYVKIQLNCQFTPQGQFLANASLLHVFCFDKMPYFYYIVNQIGCQEIVRLKTQDLNLHCIFL